MSKDYTMCLSTRCTEKDQCLRHTKLEEAEEGQAYYLLTDPGITENALCVARWVDLPPIPEPVLETEFQESLSL